MRRRRRSGRSSLCSRHAAAPASPRRPRQPPPASGATVAAAPEPVEFSSGALRLHGLLWKPAGAGPFPAVLFSHGSGGATPDETAGLPITEAAARLAPLFTRRGYAFFYPFRRGQGASADAASAAAESSRARNGPMERKLGSACRTGLLQTEQLEDVLAALAFLKEAPGIDRSRLVLVGHSFGGQLTLLAAAHDPTVPGSRDLRGRRGVVVTVGGASLASCATPPGRRAARSSLVQWTQRLRHRAEHRAGQGASPRWPGPSRDHLPAGRVQPRGRPRWPLPRHSRSGSRTSSASWPSRVAP